MSVNIEQMVIEGLRMLPPVKQQVENSRNGEVLAFVQGLVHKGDPGKTLWEKIDERIKQVPSEVWESIPTDGAEQHDHYLYGAPKK